MAMTIREYKNSDANYQLVNGDYLDNFKKLNIFVGANNSGKSRFLRKIFSSTIDEFVFFEDRNKKLKEIYDILFPRFKDYFFMADLKSLISSKVGNYKTRFNDFYHQMDQIGQAHQRVGSLSDLDVANEIKREMMEHEIYKEVEGDDVARRFVYIPIIRGLRHLDFQNDINNKKDVYTERTMDDYKFNLSVDQNKKEIFSGLTIYSEIKKMLLGSREERKFVREFENFLSESFFKKKTVTLIPSFDNDILNINIGDNKTDREIFNVGDGIQSIIISTFPAFKYKNENLVMFIEEPEITMHPSIQRVLIETLINTFENLQIFLTTHSNHFLDLTYDYPNEVSIYSFEEDGNEKFKVKNINDNKIILDLLGIRNSSVFLSNCVIWTEGVTDRMLLKKLLEIEEIKYKEDYHYTFAEYGGSNLENFDFIGKETNSDVKVKSITNTNYLVADNDGINNKNNPKYIRRKSIEKILSKNNFFDEHIEIENLVPYKVWCKTIENLLKDKPDKKIKMKEISDENEKLFDEQLTVKKIGFLLKKYLIEKIDSEPDYLDYENVRCLGEDKKTIMDYIIKAIDETGLKLKKFPKTAKKITKSIIKFIESSNKQ